MIFSEHILGEAIKVLVQMAKSGNKEVPLSGDLSSFKVCVLTKEPINPIHLPIPIPDGSTIQGDAYLVYEPK